MLFTCLYILVGIAFYFSYVTRIFKSRELDRLDFIILVLMWPILLIAYTIGFIAGKWGNNGTHN